MNVNRRGFLAALSAAAGAIALPSLLRTRPAHAEPRTDKRFLVVLGMFGGASIIDSFLPFTHDESSIPEQLNCFPQANVIQLPGSNIRAVDWSGNLFGPFQSQLSSFVAKYKDDMLVATMTGTSVNHTVAQKRSITGNGALAGRTLQEALAAHAGGGCPLPNVNMSSLGFAQNGDDTTLPSSAIMEPVSTPLTWPFALHGSRGVKATGDSDSRLLDAPDPELIALARQLRNDKLDPESSFYKTFQLSDKLQRWREQRELVQPTLEDADLITKLNMLTEASGLPLGAYGLASSPDAAAVQAAFPRWDHDPLHAQAALAYLLIKHGVSVSVTLGPNFNLVLGAAGEPLLLNPPLSFDNSHTDHRNTQAFMWQRMLEVADGLIMLLQGAELEPGSGESLWDRTLLYCATDFGRSKGRPGLVDSFGSGHDLNNGIVAISPLLAGNRVLGGVDPESGNTYGFDPQTGAPSLGTHMNEGQIFAGLAQALGVPTPGLPAMTAMTG